jgi:hypothetical protein
MDGTGTTTFVIATRDRPAQALRCVREIAHVVEAGAGSFGEAGSRWEVVVADFGRAHAVVPGRVGALCVRVAPVRAAGTVDAWIAAADQCASDSAWAVLLSDRARMVSREDGEERWSIGEQVRGLHAWDEGVAGVCPMVVRGEGHCAGGGGLPEVFGSGCAIVRTAALRGARGFAKRWCRRTLSAALLSAGGRIVYDPRVVVRIDTALERDRKARARASRLVGSGGAMARGAGLARVAAWRGFVRTFAPQGWAGDEAITGEMWLARRGVVRALRRGPGAEAGARALLRAREASRLDGLEARRALSWEVWDRLTGADAVRRGALARLRALGARRVALVHEGCGVRTIARVLREGGMELVEAQARADALVIGTLSPGAMIEHAARLCSVARREAPVLMAWEPEVCGAAEAGGVRERRVGVLGAAARAA